MFMMNITSETLLLNSLIGTTLTVTLNYEDLTKIKNVIVKCTFCKVPLSLKKKNKWTCYGIKIVHL